MNFKLRKNFWVLDVITAVVLIAIHLFFINNVSTNPLEPGFYISVFFGIFVTLFSKFIFNKTFYPTAKYMGSRLLKSINIQINSDEELIKEAGANRLMKKEGVGGKLALTDKRLIFKSHKFYIQKQEEVLNVTDIKSLNEFCFLSLQSGLMVELHNAMVYKFIVDPDTPSNWIEEINKVKNLKFQ